MPPKLHFTRGAVATEARLLELLDELLAESRAHPELLARPVRILVPSRSLRLHLSERITARHGAVLGVVVQTLFTAAGEILDRARAPARGGDPLVELYANRRAREEAALREAFDDFSGGYAVVSADVRDFLDAGFEAAHAPALLERLAEVPLSRDAMRRAHALVSTARRVAEDLDARGASGSAGLLARARAVFEREPEHTLPTRALLVHGFADATGRATDLIKSLTARLAGHVFIDQPPDPASPDELDLGTRYTEPLVERLRGIAGEPVEEPADGARSAWSFFGAPGASAEAREVARRVRRLLSRGTAPERIGLVTRDLATYAAPIARELDRLGIPLAALRARRAMDGAARRVRAFVTLLERQEATSSDRFLDALRSFPVERDGEKKRRFVGADQRLALRRLGCARLLDIAGIAPDQHVDGKGLLRLPVRKGVRVVPRDQLDPEVGSTLMASRRSVHEDDLRGLVGAARAVARRFARWPRRAPFERHVRELDRLRQRELGWRSGDPAENRIAPALARLAESLRDEELTQEEFLLAASPALESAALPPLSAGGEAGAGVQVLDVMEARARTFEHLFVLGLNRGLFPRVASADPLLDDALRARLAEVLPDVPIKARARLEDRYLFAQLASSSGAVTFSWQLADDDGKAQVASPLVERVLGPDGARDVPQAPSLFHAVSAAEEHELRDPHEYAVLGGLAGGTSGFAGRVELALGELPGAPAVAAARGRILGAYDRGALEPRALMPWLGFLGAQERDGIRPDPRVEALFVTRLESMARCPWRSVLDRLLRLEEPADPLDALPGVEPLVLGSTVHEVLQRIDENVLGNEKVDLAGAVARKPVHAEWPEPAELEDLLYGIARAQIAKHRAPTPGFVRLVMECARPYLEAARRFLGHEAQHFPEGGVLGVEVTGSARVALTGARAGDTVELSFRVDRVEDRENQLVLSDYKTGKIYKASDVLGKNLPQGTQLQAMAYVLAGRELEDDVIGRYLYLGAEAGDEDGTKVEVGSKFESYLDDFVEALSAILGGWITGAFFPRLAEPERDAQPAMCRFCGVKEACLQGDSGARRAIRELAAREAPASGPQGALQELWWLAAKKHGKASS